MLPILILTMPFFNVFALPLFNPNHPSNNTTLTLQSRQGTCTCHSFQACDACSTTWICCAAGQLCMPSRPPYDVDACCTGCRGPNTHTAIEITRWINPSTVTIPTQSLVSNTTTTTQSPAQKTTTTSNSSSTSLNPIAIVLGMLLVGGLISSKVM